MAAGSKVFDGDAKTGVDKYKKMMVGLDNDDDEMVNENNVEMEKSEEKTSDDIEIWKDYYEGKNDLLTYGNNLAQIIDYGIFDLNNKIQTTINNDDEYIVKMKVKFNEDIKDPIFAMSFKDIKGLELAGTNTKVYKTNTGEYKKGDTVVVEFKQQIPLAPERYTISFGCTKFKNNGDLEVFDRKYDAIFIEIIGYRECLGLMDLKTKINIIK